MRTSLFSRCIGLFVIISAITACTARNGKQDQQPESSGRSGSSGSTWTLAAVGDVITTRRLAQFDHPEDPAFHEMARLSRSADAAFANLEQSLFRIEDFQGWPAAETQGSWQFGPPEVAKDLKAMGFNLVNRANNHTTDYGVEGMRQTDKLLDELAIVHAGTGENLAWATR